MGINDVQFTFAEGHNHTVGNNLQEKLLQNPEVLFVSYEMEKPYLTNLAIRIQTFEDPEDCLDKAINTSIAELDDFEQAFRKRL